MNENRNFLIAVALSFVVLLLWQLFIVDPRVSNQGEPPPPASAAPQLPDRSTLPLPEDVIDPAAPAIGLPTAASPVVPSGGRVAIRSDNIIGSLALRGARLDDISLVNYAVSLKDDTPVRLLQPETSGRGWFVQTGWVAQASTPNNGAPAMPDATSLWQADAGAVLTPASPLVLRWRNPSGLVFTRHITMDEDYLFTIRDEVENEGRAALVLYPYAQLSRQGEPSEQPLFVLHEGGIGVLGEDQGLVERSYEDMRDEPLEKFSATGGWLGLTDKYWASIIIPPQDVPYQARFVSASGGAAAHIYRADYLLSGLALPAGGSISSVAQVFAGAKRVQLMDRYRADNNIYRFDLLIDWGWLYFLTKPLFILLAWFYQLVGNYGIAILLVTVVIRLVFFPLASRSFATMAQMKKLQPEMKTIRERHADDRARQQQEMMQLYRNSKINPVAGCLPLLVQIPVFFALYKVLYVTLDMRQQPFFGWVRDLSVPDPTSLFNLFGLLPFQPPSFLLIGIWPLLMGITMFVQMQMNPPPPDPIQARLFQALPIVFTFILAGFPAGLVIYWAWNNVLSIAQQAIIMRRYGVEINLLQNLGLAKKPSKDVS